MKYMFRNTVLFALIIFTALFAHFLILGGAATPAVANDPLSAGLSQALQDSAGNKYTPVYGKDFTVSGTTYFDQKAYVVVKVSPIGSSADPLVVVLGLKDGAYKPVGMPQNSVSALSTNGLPQDLVKYIKSGGK